MDETGYTVEPVTSLPWDRVLSALPACWPVSLALEEARPGADRLDDPTGMDWSR
jgi:hypothetical protein